MEGEGGLMGCSSAGFPGSSLFRSFSPAEKGFLFSLADARRDKSCSF